MCQFLIGMVLKRTILMCQKFGNKGNVCQFLIGMILKHMKDKYCDYIIEHVSIPHRYGT